MSVPVSSKKENDLPQIYQLPLGAVGTNCYIIPGEDSRALVIDPRLLRRWRCFSTPTV